MRKFLVFLLLVVLLFFLMSLFLPVQFLFKRELVIENNKVLVFNGVKEADLLADWLHNIGRNDIKYSKENLHWKRGDASYKYKILEQIPHEKVCFVFRDIESKEVFKGEILLKEKAEKVTDVCIKISSDSTINPYLRYSYWLGKKKITEKLEEAIDYMKGKIEKVKYERFYLSSPQKIFVNDIVFAVKQNSKVDVLEQEKDKNDLLKAQLSRYHLLDTTKKEYLEYTQWTDSVVQYYMCFPLIRKPSERELSRITKGKVSTIKGEYYTADYKGISEDLSLAWDSLYRLANRENTNIIGFPLEMLIKKTDSIEQRRLFIRIE